MANSTPLTPAQRSQRARLAAQARWARTVPAARGDATTPARRAFLGRFLADVDRDHPGLSDSDRHIMAEARVREHMTRLAYRSSRTRQARGTAA